MNPRVISTLQAVIAVALAGSLVVQGLVLVLAWTDDGRPDVRVPFAALLLLGVLALQVVGVCIWRLLTMVRRGTVFSLAAFRYVDVVIGSLGTGALVLLGLAALAAYSNRTTPGDEVAPGLVGLVCGFSLVTAGVALVVLVMRALLAQAVDLVDTTSRLRSELSEVI